MIHHWFGDYFSPNTSSCSPANEHSGTGYPLFVSTLPSLAHSTDLIPLLPGFPQTRGSEWWYHKRCRYVSRMVTFHKTVDRAGKNKARIAKASPICRACNAGVCHTWLLHISTLANMLSLKINERVERASNPMVQFFLSRTKLVQLTKLVPEYTLNGFPIVKNRKYCLHQ